MDEKISIVKTRKNELEFDINIRGANKKDPDVRFVIEDGDIHYSFKCKPVGKESDQWTVNIPIMKQLSKDAYPFRLEVIIDGYYFEPVRKTLTVLDEPKVKTGEVTDHPNAPTVTMGKKEEPKKPNPKKKTVVKKKEIKKVTKKEIKEEIIPETPIVAPEIVDDAFANMASNWMNREKPIVSEKDSKVKNVLKSVLETVIPKKEEPVIEKEIEPVIIPEETKIQSNDIKIKSILNIT